jgi:hypothetical protein
MGRTKGLKVSGTVSGTLFVGLEVEMFFLLAQTMKVAAGTRTGVRGDRPWLLEDALPVSLCKLG